jgi:ribosomal protein L34
MARLLSLNVGLARDITWQGKRVHTAIWRAPVHGRPNLRRLNIDGDANQQRRQVFRARSARVAGLAFLEARRRNSRNYLADAPSGGACVRRFERSAPVSSFARARSRHSSVLVPQARRAVPGGASFPPTPRFPSPCLVSENPKPRSAYRAAVSER